MLTGKDQTRAPRLWMVNERFAAQYGYEGEAATFTLPVKKPKGIAHTESNTQLNMLQAHARARAEQAKLKGT